MITKTMKIGGETVKKAVGYIRNGKRKSEIDRQKKAIDGYCIEHDMAVTDWIGMNGETFGEIAYGDWMTGKKVDAVIVADSGYVSGSVYEFYAYKSVLKRRHSDLIAVSGRFPGYDLYVKLFNELIETMCRIDLENAPIRKPHDRMDKAARGAYIGGRAPMGYKAENGQLVINEQEVPVVRFVMESKHSGKTMLGTVEALNSNGYKTRNGKPFVISTVNGIWKNEMFYRGYYRYSKDGEWVKGQHEPILKD